MRSALVLMGGKGSRMGAHKGMLLLEGKPLYRWIMESMARVADDIVFSVSGEDQIKGFDFGKTAVRIALDERQGMGPMGGLLSGLKVTGGEYVAIAPVDAPLVKPELYTYLFEKVKGHDGAVPRMGPHWEPLVAVYRRDSIIPVLEDSLAEGSLKITSLYGALDIRNISRSEIEKIDPNFNSFININTKEDLERAHDQM